MSNSLFDENNHLTSETLKSLHDNFLSDYELILVAGHLEKCNLCVLALSGSFESQKLAMVPLGFAEEVGKKISTLKEKRIQLIFYSLRVAIAACAALIIGFSGFFNFLTSPNNGVNCINAPNFAFTNTINSDIRNFSQKLLNMGVFYNVKEKR